MKIGCIPDLQDPERTSVMIVNGLSFALLIIVALFFMYGLAVNVTVWTNWLPAFLLYSCVLYLSHTKKYQYARTIFFWGSLALTTAWCFVSRAVGAEYGLVALGITSALIFKRSKAVYAACVSTLVILLLYGVHEYRQRFVADPSFSDDLTPRIIVWAFAILVFFEVMIFRSLAYRYYKKLNRKYHQVQTAFHSRKLTETELQLANEELLAANEALNNLTEQLDWMVRQKSIELQSYLDAINIHLYSAVTDVNGTIVKVNEPLLKVAGYSRRELLGGNFRILNSGYHSAEFYRNLYNCIVNGNTWRGEIRNKAKDGSYFWVDQVILPVKNESGELKYFLMIALPITERKKMEEERVKTLQMLESIAYKASHEWRAPLARILGLSHLLSHDMVKIDEFRRVTDEILVASKQLDEATRELTLFVNGHHQLFDEAVHQGHVHVGGIS